MDAEHTNSGICLPYDLLLDILRRLPGHALAASRCVCSGWRDVVDAHALLLPHVFPREFPGIFAAYKGYDPSFALFGPPAPRHTNEPGYRRLSWDHWRYCVKQHCNGLLLVTGDSPSINPYVCNPATSRYARLPCPPVPWWCGVEGMFLAFDPAMSRHNEVFFFPTEKKQCQEEQQESSSTKGPEEKVFHVFVFSSRTGQWESQKFTPRCGGLGQLYDVVTAPRAKDERTWWSAEYWRGSLYMHYHSGVLLILRCSQRTYDMIRLPRQPSDHERLYQGALPTRHLSSCDRGIRYAEINNFQLEVWELIKLADDRLAWTLAHKADLKERDHKMNYLREELIIQPRVQWAVVESNKELISLFDDYIDEESNDDCDDGTENDEDGEGDEEKEQEVDEEDNYDVAQDEDGGKSYTDDEKQDEKEEEQCNDDETQGKEEEKQDSYDDDDDELARSDGSVDSDYSWNSDIHNFIDFDNIIIAEEDVWGFGCSIVGFHPYKDMLLLKFSDTVAAYHLHTSRMQYLGYVYPCKHHQHARDIHRAFPYRPCYVDALSSRKAPTSS